MFFPAQSFTRLQHKRYIDELYVDWITNLPDKWIDEFVKYGLFPFLHTHGYTLYYDIKTVTEHCKEWAFCHVLLKRQGSRYKTRVFDTCIHSGGIEELDWYHHTISTDAWLTLCSKWSNIDFLDSSDPGYSQCMDLSIFIWHMIHLDRSKSHTIWIQHMETLEQQYDDPLGHHITLDEVNAYSGDRRTL